MRPGAGRLLAAVQGTAEGVFCRRLRPWSSLQRFLLCLFQRHSNPLFFEGGGLGGLAQARLIHSETKDDRKDPDGNSAGPGKTGRGREPIQPRAPMADRAPWSQRPEQPAANGRIGQQVFERLLVGQGIEELLIVQCGAKQRLSLFGSERIGREAAEQLFKVRFRHKKSSQLSYVISQRGL